MFSVWFAAQNKDPSLCDMSSVLTFLQELLNKGCIPSMLKVYVAAITVNHPLAADHSVGKNNLVVKFLRGAWRLNLPLSHTLLKLDLSKVLGALRCSPFELIQSDYLQALSLKTALFLALASVKRVGDLQAFLVSASCLSLGLMTLKRPQTKTWPWAQSILHSIQSTSHHPSGSS